MCGLCVYKVLWTMRPGNRVHAGLSGGGVVYYSTVVARWGGLCDRNVTQTPQTWLQMGKYTQHHKIMLLYGRNVGRYGVLWTTPVHISPNSTGSGRTPGPYGGDPAIRGQDVGVQKGSPLLAGGGNEHLITVGGLDGKEQGIWGK